MSTPSNANLRQEKSPLLNEGGPGSGSGSNNNTTTAVANIYEDGSADKATNRSCLDKISDHLWEPVSVEHTDYILMASYFVSGLVDASMNYHWGCYGGTMTGNTLSLAIGLATLRGEMLSEKDMPDGTNYDNAKFSVPYQKALLCAIAIVAFCPSSIVVDHCYKRSARLMKQRAVAPVPPSEALTPEGKLEPGSNGPRWAVVLFSALDALMYFAAAALTAAVADPSRTGGIIDNSASGTTAHSRYPLPEWFQCVSLLFTSFAGAIPMLTSRVVKHGFLTCTTLTTNMCDMASNPTIVATKGKAFFTEVAVRERLIGIIVMWCGAVVSAVFTIRGGFNDPVTGAKNPRSLWIMFVIGATLKVCVTLNWAFFWRRGARPNI